jgi:sigma-B regulation protein RsbU (phosphoserine phosphatase)
MTNPIYREDAIAQENFEHFFEHSLAGFLITDTKNGITRANTRVATWLATTTAELKGKRFSDLLSIGSKIYFETHLGPLLRMQGFFDEILLELSDGSGQRKRVLINALEYKDADGNPLGIYYTITKATDRLQFEQNLQHAKSEAEKELEREKENVLLREQLIAVLGHDLRNPLGAISMAVELLADSSLDSVDRELLATLKRSSYRMTELIANIMDFAKTRLGEGIVINSQPTILQPVLRQVIGELKLLFPQTEIVSAFNMEEPVRCDAHRIAQLFSNLLANALTHGSAGTPVHTRVSHIKNLLEISVTNEGPPIPAAFHELLFAPFTREGDRPSKNGLGLGLFIAAEIARAHNATLSFTSDTANTCFIFSMNTSTISLP